MLRESYLSCAYTCPVEIALYGYPFVSYVMLVRPSPGITEGERGTNLLVHDAVLIVESSGCNIEYCEPRDLNWEKLWEGESPFGLGKLNSLHANVVRAVRVDGKVIDIPKEISNDKLRKLLNGSKK